MMEILIIFVVIGLICSLAKKLFDWIKDRAEVIAGIAILVVIAAIVIAVGSVLLPILLVNLPVVLIGSLIIIVTYSTLTKKKRRSYVAWAERVGFGKQSDAPGSERIWKWARENGHTEDSGSGYVWHVEFYKRVLNGFYARQAATEAEFRDLCIQAAPMFDPTDTRAFLDCLRWREILVPLDEPGEETVYLSGQIVTDCEHLFEKKGGATAKEFSQICEIEMGHVPVRPLALARCVLDNMVSQGAVNRVNFKDGETLYVSKDKNADCEMKRVEISMDD